jgi:LAS superfamily LD-carboxypeptidase LdcB
MRHGTSQRRDVEMHMTRRVQLDDDPSFEFDDMSRSEAEFRDELRMFAAEPGAASRQRLAFQPPGAAGRLRSAGDDVVCEGELPEREEEQFEEEAWTRSPEQVAFQERVLAAQIERTRRRKKRPPGPGVSRDQLRPVRGTGIVMRADAAEAASRLLEAAHEALATAKAAGHPDALKTIKITSRSGYRGPDTQRQLWRKYFPSYYRKTRAARERMAEGPHSDRAVRYMLEDFGIPKRIGAPGWGNHLGGTAIDFKQIRTKGSEVVNAYDHQRAWRSSWFFAWLKENAATFGFKPYVNEAWHWEYRPTGAARELDVI